jgi:hypothetical protein
MAHDDEITEPDQAPPAIYDESGRPRFFSEPSVDRLTSVLLQLASEVWILAERIENLENLAQRRGFLTYDEIKHYVPDSDDAERRDMMRDRFVQSVFGVVRESRRESR